MSLFLGWETIEGEQYRAIFGEAMAAGLAHRASLNNEVIGLLLSIRLFLGLRDLIQFGLRSRPWTPETLSFKVNLNLIAGQTTLTSPQHPPLLGNVTSCIAAASLSIPPVKRRMAHT